MTRPTRAAIAVLALAACHDAPARPSPRPTAPAQASRAVLEQVMTTAASAAELGRRLAPPDQPVRFALDDDGVPDNPVGDLQGDLDDLQGGLVGDVVGGLAIDPPPPPPPPPPPRDHPDITIQVTTDGDDLDPASVRLHTRLMRLRTELCLREHGDDVSGPITANVSLSGLSSGSPAVYVSGAGPLTDCLRQMRAHTDLPSGATLTFQIEIPAP